MEQGKISRREFFKVAGTALGSSILAACAPNLVGNSPTPQSTDTETPTSVPLTATPAEPTQTPTPEFNQEKVEKTTLGAVYIINMGGTQEVLTPGLTNNEISAMRETCDGGILFAQEGARSSYIRKPVLAGEQDLGDNQPYIVTAGAVPSTFTSADGATWNILTDQTKAGIATYADEEDPQNITSLNTSYELRPGFLPTGAALHWSNTRKELEWVFWDGNKNPIDAQVPVTEILSDAESKFYHPEKVVPVTFTVDGVTLNWKLGLMQSLVERTTEPVTDVIIHPEEMDQLQFLGHLYIEMCRENYNAFSGKAPVDYNTAAQMMSEGKLFIKLGGVDESTAGNPSTGSEIVIHNLTDSDWLFSGSYGSWPVCMGNVYVYLAENQNGKPLIGDGFDEQYFSLIPNYNVSSNEGIRNVKGYLFMACLIGKIALIGFCAKPNVNANFEKGDLYGHYSDVAPVGYADWANFETPFAQDVWNKYGSKVETGGQMVFELVQ